MTRLEHKGKAFDVALDVRDENFLRFRNKETNDLLRPLILDQHLKVLAEELAEFDRGLQRAVPGATLHPSSGPWATSRAQDHDQRLTIDNQQVMQAWEEPLMRALAASATKNGGDVLEVGFGMGISATHVQSHRPRSHTIIEANHDVIGQFERWRRQYATQDIRLVQGRWQDVIGTLGVFDGILFDTYEPEFIHALSFADGLFAPGDQFLPFACEHLRQGGIYTYYTGEIDSFGRAHQKRVLAYFEALTLRVISGLRPPEDCNYWFFDSMVAVEAVKG